MTNERHRDATPTSGRRYTEGVAKKLTLPLLSSGSERATGATPAPRPSIDVARARLGGKPEVDEAKGAAFLCGQHVSFGAAGAERTTGIVVYASPSEVHVMLDAARVRRVAAGEVATEGGEPLGALATIAADVRVFSLLTEHHAVRYATASGELEGGKLVEKCRYGALVLRGDGVIVAVGFRKLWPAPAPNVIDA